MKKTLVLALVFVAQAASAHIEPGTYTGKTPAGQDCSMKAIRRYFEGGMAHPLNERVVVEVLIEEFTLSHPALVDTSKGRAFFNHNVLQSVFPTKTGARALAVDMNHEEGHEGPKAFHLIEDQWKANIHTSLDCLDLQFHP